MLQRLKHHAARTLRWSEQYTKTDMIYLTKGGFWLAFGHGVQVASGLILAVAFANLLPKESYGTYQFIMSVAAIMSALTLSGMSTAIKRAVANGNEGALPYGFKTQLVWSTSIVFVGGALALYYFMNGNNTLAISFLIVGALSPFIEGFSLYKAYLIGTKRFKESAFLGFWRRPIFLIAVLIAVFLTNDPAILVLVYFAASAISAGLLYWLVIRKYNLRTSPDSSLINYSKHLSIMGLASTIGNNADKVLIFYFLGPAPLAIYTLATLPFIHINKALGLSKDLAFPKFSRYSFTNLRKTLHTKVMTLFVVTIGIVCAYIFTAQYIYAILFPAYPEAVLLSQVAICALLFRPSMLYNQVFTAQGIKKAQYFIQITAAILRIVIPLVLLPVIGVWGAIWALVIIYAYTAFVSIITFYIQKV